MSRTIYDITQQMKNQDTIQSDFREAAAMVVGYFQNKYTNKLAKAVELQRKKVSEAPPEEVRLLNAMKPFLRAEQRQAVDQMIDFCLLAAAVQNIGQELRQPNYPGALPDGSFQNGSFQTDLLGLLLITAF